MSAFMCLPSPVRRDGVFFLLSILAVGLFLMRAESLHELGFPLDDAWIHQTYARNLAEQGEWAFIAGQPSAASTAPLYSALLVTGHILNLSPFLWASVLGVLALSLGAAMAARIGERLFPQTRFVGWGTGLAVLLAWHMVWAAASGMETMLFMALSLTVIWLTLREMPLGNYKAGLWLGILGGLLTLTRPEGIALMGAVGLLTLVVAAPQNPRWYFFWAVMVGAGWLVVVAPYAIWNYDLTGDVLPATADAKIAEYAPLRETSLLTRYVRMFVPILVGAQVLALPGILVGIGLILKRVRDDRQQLLLLIPLLWAFTHLTIFVIRLPANYQHGRYAMPILPPLLLYAGGGLLHLVERYRHDLIGRVLTRSLALSASAAFPAFLWIGAGAYASDVRIINTEMVATAQWVHDHPELVPPDDLFAVHDIGALGYFAPRHILDLAGLVTPEVVPIIRDKAALMNLICQRGAKWLMVLPDQRPAPADDPRLQVIYESPYDFADQAAGDREEPWKMRVYAVDCSPRALTFYDASPYNLGSLRVW